MLTDKQKLNLEIGKQTQLTSLSLPPHYNHIAGVSNRKQTKRKKGTKQENKNKTIKEKVKTDSTTICPYCLCK